MVLKQTAKKLLEQITKKNTRSKGTLPTGRVKAPESNLVEIEVLEHPERYIENLPTLERPTDSYGGFYISESSREDFKRQSRNRWIEFETYKDTNRLKYQLRRYEEEQKKRRGYTITFPAAYRTGKRREPKEAAILDVPSTGVATQPSGIPTPTDTVLDEPGFDIPADIEEGKPKDPEKEFETCQDLEEKIFAITGVEISLCGQRDVGATLLNLSIAPNKTNRMVFRKGQEHRRGGNLKWQK